MKGDLVVVVDPYMGPPQEQVRKYRSFLYESISGDRWLGVAEEGEHLILLGTKCGRDGNIKVLHPTVGICFIRAIDIVVVDEAR